MSIALSCPSCDKALKVRDELAGKRVKCPGCGKPILVAAEEETELESAVTDTEPLPRRKPRPEEEEDDRPRKKKKKKKKSSSLLWILVGGGAVLLLLLLAGGGILYYFLNRPAETKTTAQVKKKEEPPPKLDPPPNNPRPKSGIPRGMDVQEIKNAMKQIGLAYHNCVSSNNKAPAKMQDLMQFLERNALIEKLLTDGTVVFVYGVKPQDMTDGSSNTLLAYEKEQDTRGYRVVLFGDGSVDMLPDEEFQAKPKAQPRN